MVIFFLKHTHTEMTPPDPPGDWVVLFWVGHDPPPPPDRESVGETHSMYFSGYRTTKERKIATKHDLVCATPPLRFDAHDANTHSHFEELSEFIEGDSQNPIC